VDRLADEQAALRRVATLVARGESLPTTVFAAVADTRLIFEAANISTRVEARCLGREVFGDV
jgi:hypothetical protein